MNEPIVSPLFVYFAGIVEGLSTVIIIFSVLGIVAAITIFLISSFECNDSDEFIKYIKKFKFKQVLIPSIIGCILACFMPTQKTMICMAVANNITPNMVSAVKDNAKSAIDYTVDKIIEIMKEEKSEK